MARARMLLLTMLVLALLAASAYLYLTSRDGPEQYASLEDHFKYGSIGAEKTNGIPLWIWEVLPELFPDLLPGGYASLGFVFEPGHDRPIGTSLRTSLGVTQVGVNCALCHTSTFRVRPDAERQIILGMPAHRFDLQRYIRFVTAVASDPRFTADNILAAVEKRHRLSIVDALLYRYLVIPATRDGLIALRQRFSWMNNRPEFGPGRVDTFTPYKQLFGIDLTEDTSIGIADLPSLWNQATRANHYSQWDGNNNSLAERNKSASFGAGATPESVDIPSLDRVEAYINRLPPPKYPFPVHAELAAQGERIFRAQCASCHAFDGDKVGQVTAIAEIRTDPHRFDSFTQQLIDNLNTLGTGYPWRFSHFRKSTGYANQPLDGIWARAPYLHNGSVPSLRDLFETPENRPIVFYRGYDVLDAQNGGFVATGSEAERFGFRFDTRLLGNGNGGHLYGTDLSGADKVALMEYLKQQ